MSEIVGVCVLNLARVSSARLCCASLLRLLVLVSFLENNFKGVFSVF